MTDEGFAVRDARPADHPALQRIFRAASLSNDGDREALLAHPEVLQLSGDLVSAGRARVATLADDTVIGFASTTVSGPETLELDDLFVDPGWQRRGAARMLMARIVEEAEAEGQTRIDVTANEHARAFYSSAGFVDGGPVQTEFGVGIRMHLTVGNPAKP